MTHERRIVDRDGRAVEVIVPIAEFEELKAEARKAEILRRFATGASLAELSAEYRLGRVALEDLIAEHGLDPNRYDAEEVAHDQVTLSAFRAKNPHGA